MSMFTASSGSISTLSGKLRDDRDSMYNFIKNIGRGNFGNVDEVEVVESFSNGKYNFTKDMRLAMKKSLPLGIRYCDEFKEYGMMGGIGGMGGVLIEIDILNRVNHVNVINSYDTFIEHFKSSGRKVEPKCEDCSDIILIMPLATYNLSDLIKTFTEQPALKNIEILLSLSHQLLCGLEYLHSNYIIHDDIKSDNILVFEDEGKYVVKISDFGISGVLVHPDGVNKSSQSEDYRPPEILETGEDTAKHAYESDNWAMGVLLLQLVTGKLIHDFEGVDPYDVSSYYRLVSEFLRKADWKSNPEWDEWFGNNQNERNDFIKLIDGLLNRNPKQRLTSREALDDSLFKTFDCSIDRIIYQETPLITGITTDQRKITLIWMKEIVDKLNIEHSALFLGIDIFDRYMAIKNQDNVEIDHNEIKLIAFASLMISIPIIFSDEYFFENLIDVIEKMYHRMDINNMICVIAKTLEWKLFRPTLNVTLPHMDDVKIFEHYLNN